MRIEELKYELRAVNLEGTPREIRLGRRDLGRLVVVDRTSGRRFHSRVRLLPEWLHHGDVVVLNNSKRIPGVLKGRTTRGGKVELRFVDLDDDGNTGLCRIFPMHDVESGSRIALRSGTAEVLDTELTAYGLARVRVATGLRNTLREQGLPISGFFYNGHWGTEALNPYYATEEGSVESPLAGLHFTRELVEELGDIGVSVAFVTLHSVGSWLPFLEENVEDHVMWAEKFCVPEATAQIIRHARAVGGRVIACGSTALRALESAAADGRNVNPSEGRTSLYIKPGYAFNVVDGYFTNFHQYQTSLIVLDAAFAGHKLVMDVYSEASQMDYAFFEFGDAILYT